MKRVNYLNNKDILKEIHKSKSSFCSFVDPEYAQYDIILPNTDKINIRTIAEAKRNKAKRLGLQDYEARKEAGQKVKQADCEVDYKKALNVNYGGVLNLLKIIKNKKLELSERFAAQLKLNKLPKNSSKIRIRNRCEVSGRPHGVYRKLRISRIALRDMASSGKIPGITKSSW